ncbi:MAG: MotA/TolQ/ExbB proton channel family protein [Deltaproteobacteria bacterium]|nr:MAG: MotA/TolQ/ExbB proton channel family protein [Deltaproteobacteria bacterium]
MLSERLLELSLVGAEWVLWLLIILSFFSVALVADRAILYFRTREKLGELEPALNGALARGDVAAARKALDGDSLVRNVLRAGLDAVQASSGDPARVEQAMLGTLAREKARYEARLTPLGTIGNNAPFVGLFGTVLGIINAFHNLGKLDASQVASNQIVMSAIGDALVATGVGIMVAIPAVAAYNWAKSSVKNRVRHAQALMGALLAGLGKSSLTPVAREDEV